VQGFGVSNRGHFNSLAARISLWVWRASWPINSQKIEIVK
jgi:hypothetical protein